MAYDPQHPFVDFTKNYGSAFLCPRFFRTPSAKNPTFSAKKNWNCFTVFVSVTRNYRNRQCSDFSQKIGQFLSPVPWRMGGFSLSELTFPHFPQPFPQALFLSKSGRWILACLHNYFRLLSTFFHFFFCCVFHNGIISPIKNYA